MIRTLKLLGTSLVLGAFAVPVSGQSPEQIAQGAQVWAQNCTRCHKARAPQERTDRHWRTIVSHMRARANLRKSQAEAVAVYLSSINLPEQVAMPPGALPQQDDEEEPADSQEEEGGGEPEGAGSSGMPHTPDG